MKHTLYFLVIAFLVGTLCSCQGKVLYQNGNYTIRKKTVLNFNNESPDLYIRTIKGEIKINLDEFGEHLIPQEKITDINITQINDDSILIQFTSDDYELPIREEFVSINIRNAIDSALAMK